MSRINRLPRGFQDFLGNTNFGDNPSNLAQEVRATVDIGPFYAVDEQRIGSEAEQNVSANGNVLTYTVPSGRTWFVQAVGFAGRQLTGTVGTDELSLTWLVTGMPLGSVAASVPIYLAGFKSVTFPASGGNAIGFMEYLPRPFAIPGNSVLTLQCAGLSGGSFGIRPNFFYLDFAG